MRKSFKGFTLIECVVALAILGIASLTMAQIYAGVSNMNRKNHELNTSMSNQTSFIEKKVKSDGVNEFKCVVDTTQDYSSNPASPKYKPPHEYMTNNKVTTSYVLFTELDTDSDGDGALDSSSASAPKYSYPIDVYLLKSRDKDNKDSSDTGYSGADESKVDLRYKFFTAH